ncbi:MAG: hypothetical protein KAX38_03525, partial [Candidatus Krumholzibacteria bacterium]|nr:hypothetical protein [Candidatus Krumholzibacteria bacterium]
MFNNRLAGLGFLVIVFLVVTCGSAYTGRSLGLTPDMIKKVEGSFKLDPGTRALMNAITNNNAKDLAFNRELFGGYNDIFNFKIEAKGITDQESSGRCWLFAGLNIMRPALIEKYNLSSFEFSENYLFFWDKLEKANMFLEAIIETRKSDINDRELQVLLKDPVPDGGWWSYVVSLIDKYGVVPKNFMPETKNSSKTRMMNAVVNRMMRHDAAKLRRLAAGGKKESDLRALKVDMLKSVYRILALHLGVPPKEFTWRYKDKDEKIVEGDYTPVSFYREAVGVDLGEYISIFDHPVHPYNKYYRIRFCRNMPDLPDMDFINLNVDRLKDFALKAVLNNEPTWFAADVGKEN